MITLLLKGEYRLSRIPVLCSENFDILNLETQHYDLYTP